MFVLAAAAVIAWCSSLVCCLLVIYFLYGHGLFARERLRCVCARLGLCLCTQIDARCCCLLIFALVCARSPSRYTGFGPDRSFINFPRTTRDRALARYPPTELSLAGGAPTARGRAGVPARGLARAGRSPRCQLCRACLRCRGHGRQRPRRRRPPGPHWAVARQELRGMHGCTTPNIAGFGCALVWLGAPLPPTRL